MKKPFLAAAIAAAALAPFAAQAQSAAPAASGKSAPAAQASAAPTVGAKVYGPDGAEAGTIEKVDAANAVVNTGSKRATLPLAAFGKNEKGLLISMSKAQLEAAVAAAEAQTASATNTALVADAQVKTSDGIVVGSVQKVEGDNVTLKLAEGNAITVTKQFLTTAPDGTLALTMNEAAFKSAVSSATQAAGGATTGTDAAAKAGAQKPAGQ